MTLLLRCVSAGIELRCHLGHAYIISNTLYTGCDCSGCWFHLGSAYLHIGKVLLGRLDTVGICAGGMPVHSWEHTGHSGLSPRQMLCSL